jgi:hypothetical protein
MHRLTETLDVRGGSGFEPDSALIKGLYHYSYHNSLTNLGGLPANHKLGGVWTPPPQKNMERAEKIVHA